VVFIGISVALESRPGKSRGGTASSMRAARLLELDGGAGEVGFETHDDLGPQRLGILFRRQRSRKAGEKTIHLKKNYHFMIRSISRVSRFSVICLFSKGGFGW